MATKVFNMEGGLHSAAAYSAFENRAYGSCVASTDSFVVTAGTSMNVRISAGDGLIDTGLNFARRIQSDAQETVAIAAASTAYNRIDSVVAYIDTSVTPTTSVVDNTNGILKFASVAGTAASSPQAPNQAAIQSAIGAGKPYMLLYNVTVPTNATNLMSATFTDLRKVVGVIMAEQLPTDIITTPKIKNQAVTSSKIDFTTLNFGNYSTSEVNTGFKFVDGKTIYSRTSSGTVTATGGTRTSTPLFTVTGLSRIISCDGWWHIGFTGIDNLIPGSDSVGRGSSVSRTNDGIFFVSTTEQPRTDAPYTVRVFYTKV